MAPAVFVAANPRRRYEFAQRSLADRIVPFTAEVHPMSDFGEDLLLDNTNILVARPSSGSVFIFSNSGKGGKRNWFTMTASQLSSSLEDILANVDDFPGAYHEKTWRGLFADNLNDDVARTMGAVQTLPLFEILAKIIHYASNGGPRAFKTINLEPAKIRHAIELLNSYTPEAN